MLSRRRVLAAGTLLARAFWAGEVSNYQFIFNGPSDYVGKKFGAFVHFNMNTWTGNGAANCSPLVSPNTFNPSALNTAQWAATYVAAKMRYAVLTARHGQGFCVWPTATQSFNVGQSSWYAANNNLDIVASFCSAMRNKGIVPCLYLSTADLSYEHQNPGVDWTLAPNQALYLAHVKAQLTELLSNYGRIGAIWIDNNNWGLSGTGYSGFNPPSNIYYPFAGAADLKAFVKGIQPNCLVVYDDHQFTLTSTDILEYEIFNGSGAITSSNPSYAEETQTVFDVNQAGLGPNQGPYFADANYTCITAASIISEVPRVVSCGGSFLLNAPPNQTGQIDSSVATVLATVGAALP